MNRIFGKIALLITILIGFAALPAVSCRAQYFISEHLSTKILESGRFDTVILLSATSFDVPAMNDTLPLIYHEPMPDSIMPRSAIVIGTITVQELQAEDVVPAVEKYARKLGANWLVSFQEPKPLIEKNGWKVYRSKALLLRVLDDQFIPETHIAYTYEEQTNLPNYAAVSQWFEQYGQHYGSDLTQPSISGAVEMDQLKP